MTWDRPSSPSGQPRTPSDRPHWRSGRASEVSPNLLTQGLSMNRGSLSSALRVSREAPARPSLVLNWNDALPVRVMRGPARVLPLGTDAPPWYETGPVDRPFQFCQH